MRLCKCGCGEEVTSRIPTAQYRQGHATRVHHQGFGIQKRYVPTPDEIPSGFCECGCGQRTKIVPLTEQTERAKRYFPGHPYPFLQYHGSQGRGAENHMWMGGRRVTYHGYVAVYAPDHPAAHKGAVLEHRLVMERVLGRPLRRDELVHHKNGDKQDNRPENLEVLTSWAEHSRRHRAEEKLKGIRHDGTPRRGMKSPRRKSV